MMLSYFRITFVTLMPVRGANWPSFTGSVVEPSLRLSVPKIPRAFHLLTDELLLQSTLTVYRESPPSFASASKLLST